LGQQVVINSGGTPDSAPLGALKINSDITELYSGADVAALTVASQVNASDLVDVLQSQGSVAFTASVGGATGGTLTSAIASGTYVFLFSDGETQVVAVTTGGTACTWPFALNAGTITSAVAYLRKQATVGSGFKANTSAANVGATPQWVHVGNNIAYSAFSAAALTDQIALFTLPACGIVEDVLIKHSAAFGGGAVSACTISVGISGSPAALASAFNVFQAPGSSVYQVSNDLLGGDRVSTTQIYATATSVGANLSALTTGAVDIWAKISVAL
jgi:hypothetical protein